MTPYYEDESVTLYHADCREVLRSIDPLSDASLLTDPPYGISLRPQRGKTSFIQNDGKREAKALLSGVLPELDRILDDDSSHLIFSAWNAYWMPEILSEWFEVKGCIIWDKLNFGIGHHLRPQHEFLWLLHKGTPPVPEVAPSNVWRESRIQAPEHSCEKPVKLMQRAVLFLGSHTFLDPFSGVGSSLVAAKNLNRKAIGCELEERYCEIAANRLSQGILALTDAA